MVTNKQRPRNGKRVDTMINALAHPRRRSVLEALSDLSDDPVDFETIVDRVQWLEATDESDANRRQIARSLHHVHLPKLADIGVIVYDSERRQITHQRTRVADVLAVASRAVAVERSPT
ncbi:DUF7344 domain-containing protein [Halegenticoccus tardaugens]|uniref:DUF7344 domain-containing protein n=1 Tax=Halegenticoccus tardaugens TaxID=2071624 RepID=UPI00100AF9E0|nr:hypothetical protein [Halegenticoccus tardaugens]